MTSQHEYYEQQSAGFRGRLINSEVARQHVAKWFRKKGYKVIVPVMTVAEGHEDRMNHQDSGDIFVQGLKGVENARIEVKQISRKWYGRDGWPFRDWIVMNKHRFDSADPPIYCTFCCNHDLTEYSCCYSNSSMLWEPEIKEVDNYKDKDGKKKKEEFYMAPLSHVYFRKFEETGEE